VDFISINNKGIWPNSYLIAQFLDRFNSDRISLTSNISAIINQRGEFVLLKSFNGAREGGYNSIR
jgi:hypothetical protein